MDQFKFEVKNMGLNFYIPIIIFLVVFCSLFFLPAEQYELQLLIFLQTVFVPFSAWWSIYLVYELYQNQSEEILLLCYPRNLILNFIKFESIFIIMLALIVATFYVILPDVSIFKLLILLISQALLISSLGLLLAIFFKNIETPFMIIVLYIATELLTLGDVFLWPHMFFFDFNFTFREIVFYAISSMLLVTVSLYLSYVNVRTIERKII